MNGRARSKMARARSELVLDHPFFARLALGLEMREDPGCGTAWSDGKVLAYNPAYIEAMPLEKVKGLQCHEVLHLACGHHLRRHGRDGKLWNMACDYAINPVLIEAGLALPNGFLDDPAHHGKSAEAIFAVLIDRGEEARGGAESGPERETDPGGEVEGMGAGADRLGGDEQASSSGDASDREPDASGERSGGEDGDGEAQAPEGDDPGMSGEVRDAPNDSPGGDRDGGRAREDEWRLALAQAVNASRRAGDLSGGLERLVSQSLAPTVDWRELLARFVCSAAKNDFSWTRPSRRHQHAGLYLPSLHTQELADIAVAVDVSGSITQAHLDGFAAELSAVLEEFDATLTVLTCDAALTGLERLGRWDLPLDLKATGGGGTDFRPPFERLEQEGLAPACLIYFTDMNCNRYPREPGYPVLWVTPNRDHAPPPFGQVAHMEPRI